MASIFDRLRLRPPRTFTPGSHAGSADPADPAGSVPASELPLDLDPAEFMANWTPTPGEGNPLLDVRRPDEYAQGHLEDALLMDVTAPDFQDRIRALDLDPDAPVYLYCRTGNRSGHAARMLRDMGMGKAVNVGGLDDLVAAGGTLAG
jgi:phage shock protein E